MKKVFAFILCLNISFYLFVASSESFTIEEIKNEFKDQWDAVTELSDQDLIVVKTMVDIEVYERNLPHLVLQQGGIMTVYNPDEYIEEDSFVEPWFETGLGALLPNPESVLGKKCDTVSFIKINSDSMFMHAVDNVTKEDFELYTNAVKDYGFNNRIQNGYGLMFEAEKDNKYKVQISFVDYSNVKGNYGYDSQMIVCVDIIK